MYPREFYRNSALKEIYQFAQRYHKQVSNVLMSISHRLLSPREYREVSTLGVCCLLKVVEDLEDGYPKHRNPNLTTLLREINSTLDERSAPMTDYV